MILFKGTNTGADPGFPVGGGANPRGGGGRQHMILLNFAKNCMKLRIFWTVGGGGGGAHPKSATGIVHFTFVSNFSLSPFGAVVSSRQVCDNISHLANSPWHTLVFYYKRLCRLCWHFCIAL